MRLAAAGPSFSKALLDGAKTVRSLVSSTTDTRLVAFSAATRSVKPASRAVSEMSCGKVKTLSILWMMPPFHGISYVYERFFHFRDAGKFLHP